MSKRYVGIFRQQPKKTTTSFYLVLFYPHCSFLPFHHLFSRPSTLRASAMKSSKSPPSLWIQTQPSPCQMLCLISGSCQTRATLMAWWYLGTPWSKGTTPRLPPLSSMPPHRDWNTWVWESWTSQEEVLCWRHHWEWWGVKDVLTVWNDLPINTSLIFMFRLAPFFRFHRILAIPSALSSAAPPRWPSTSRWVTWARACWGPTSWLLLTNRSSALSWGSALEEETYCNGLSLPNTLCRPRRRPPARYRMMIWMTLDGWVLEVLETYF